jgi:hypothetical protein
MNKEDSLQFMRERLGQHQADFPREFQLHPAPGVVRRFAIEMEQGENHVFEHVDTSFTVRCVSGGVWITLADDPKDAILITGETYQAEREGAMHLYALTNVALEIVFEDPVTQH